MYPKPVSTSVHDKTVAMCVGKIEISIESIEVHAATSATPITNLKNNLDANFNTHTHTH